MKICFLFLVYILSTSIQAQSVSGTIKDTYGLPVSDAFVLDTKTNKNVVSDFDGNFTIESEK